MIKAYTVLTLVMFLAINVQSQENPKIDKKSFFNSSKGIEKAKKDFKTAEKYFDIGAGTFDEALKYYLKLYSYNSKSKELNYKIGVCYLWTSNKKESLTYFLNSSPEVASDYYLLLGRSYQYNMKFSEAKDSYEKYLASLSKWKKFDASKRIHQLVDECNATETLLKEDSLPVFIINLGPVINSYYDEYGAYLFDNDSTIFFTSKRPEEEPINKVSRFSFTEQILVSNNCLNQPSNYANPIEGIAFVDNTSLAGVDMNKKRIYFYRGGVQNGRLMKADYIGNKWKTKKLKGSINHIAYKETSISIADNGTTYFVTDRRGGLGGKDIWMCQQIGDNKFGKPVNLGKNINTAFDEEGVFVSRDGKTLYFSSKGRKGLGGFDIYKTERMDDSTWTEPKNMGYPINSMADDLFYHPTADSMVALFSSIRDNSYGGLDIYKIQIDPRIPFKLIGSVTDSTTGLSLSATVTIYEGKMLNPILTTSADSMAGIYMLNFEDRGNYSIQVDCDGYKSISEEILCPEVKYSTIAKDFKMVKLKNPFTLIGRISDIDTDKPLQAAITFRLLSSDALVSESEMADSTVQEKTDSIIGRVISVDSTGNYTITFDDKYNMIMTIEAKDYFSTQEPVNSLNEPDAIISKNIALKRSKIDYNLTGIVTQEDQTTPVYTTMGFFIPGSDTPFAIIASDSITGKYSVLLESPGPFLIELVSNGFFFLNETFQFSDGQTFVAKNFVLKKMESGVKIVIENILFTSGKATLLPSSFKELDKLANLLLTNPTTRIEVSGHTDNVGSAAINKKVSKERALTVRNYLVSRGVEEERVEYQGYGFDQPIAPNDTPEGKAQNRRVEIKILK